MRAFTYKCTLLGPEIPELQIAGVQKNDTSVESGCMLVLYVHNPVARAR